MFGSFMGILMLGAVVAVIVALLVAIHSNIRRAELWRNAILARMGRLRMKRALEQRGIDPHRHVHTQRLVDLEAQLDRCERCTLDEACDQALAEGRFAWFHDCPNDADMKRSGAGI